MSADHGKDIAVADIANKPLYMVYDNLPLDLAIIGFMDSVASFTVDPSLNWRIPVAGLSAIYLSALMAAKKHGFSSLTDERHPYDLLLFGSTDARRNINARGIYQHTLRSEPGSQLLYVGPHAHADRIRWNLEHPHNIINNIKAKAYRLTMPGLDFSTRVYTHDQQTDQWVKTHSYPIAVC